MSPAYDMTYIFDTGGYLPNKEHCLMIGGNLQNITRNDIIDFTRENGISRPDSIIRSVIESLKKFRTIATKNGVSDQWIGMVEATIAAHIKEWDTSEPKSDTPTHTLNGHIINNIRIEQTYKGNFHLLATIDSKSRKFIISKNKDEYTMISTTGIANLTENQLISMAEKYFGL